MHDKHSHIWSTLLLLGCFLFSIGACSSERTPARTFQTITPTLHGATPSAHTGATALLTYTGHIQAVLSLGWSPNGNYVASGSNDRTVHVWDATTGKRILIYHGHKTGVTSISWSPDGTRIASGGSDSTVQIWKPI